MVDTLGGRMHVRWDDGAAATPHGQLVFFAEFLANEVPGVVVPEEIIARMRKASDQSKEHAIAEGIAIAREMFERVRHSVQGVQVSAPFGRVELALRVFE